MVVRLAHRDRLARKETQVCREVLEQQDRRALVPRDRPAPRDTQGPRVRLALRDPQVRLQVRPGRVEAQQVRPVHRVQRVQQAQRVQRVQRAQERKGRLDRVEVLRVPLEQPAQ